LVPDRYRPSRPTATLQKKGSNMGRAARIALLLGALGTLIYSIGAPWWSGG